MFHVSATLYRRKYPRLQAAAAASKMRPCEVSLIEQHRSPSNRGRDCVKEKNVGCTDGIGDAVDNLPKHDPKFFPWLTTMETVVWIGPGCRGAFLCNGRPVTCGYPGHRIDELAPGVPGRRNCSCSDSKVDGAISALPSHLDSIRLVEAWQGKSRFVPSTSNETLSAVFTFWNLLDGTMHATKDNGLYQTGYVREIQVRRMIDLVQRASPEKPQVTYCEIGMNGGHSAVAMLLADRRVQVHSFDLFRWGYSWPVAAQGWSGPISPT